MRYIAQYSPVTFVKPWPDDNAGYNEWEVFQERTQKVLASSHLTPTRVTFKTLADAAGDMDADAFWILARGTRCGGRFEVPK